MSIRTELPVFVVFENTNGMADMSTAVTRTYGMDLNTIAARVKTGPRKQLLGLHVCNRMHGYF